jgi:hypothetical protein
MPGRVPTAARPPSLQWIPEVWQNAFGLLAYLATFRLKIPEPLAKNAEIELSRATACRETEGEILAHARASSNQSEISLAGFAELDKHNCLDQS